MNPRQVHLTSDFVNLITMVVPSGLGHEIPSLDFLRSEVTASGDFDVTDRGFGGGVHYVSIKPRERGFVKSPTPF